MSGMSDWPARQNPYAKQDTPESDLATQVKELKDLLVGKEITGVPKKPSDIGRKAVLDVQKGIQQYGKEEIPDLFERYQADIQANRGSPAELSAAWEAAARGAGIKKGVIKKAGELAAMLPGIPSREQYGRYIPALQKSASDLLGRTLSGPEVQNYISSLQGMGVTNPADIISTAGKIMTTGEEYQDRQVARTYRFRPSSGISQPSTSNTEAFQRLLNASIA